MEPFEDVYAGLTDIEQIVYGVVEDVAHMDPEGYVEGEFLLDIPLDETWGQQGHTKGCLVAASRALPSDRKG